MSALPPDARFLRWHEHFCACQQTLVGYLARKTGCLDEARELAQETWLRVAESGLVDAGEADLSPERARGYIFTTADHLCVDRLRRRRRHDRAMVDLARLGPASDLDVADRVMYRQALAAVDKAIEDLPERMHDAFVSHRLDGEKQAAIARRHGVSLNLIERDLARAGACVEAAVHRWRGSGANDLAQLNEPRSRRRRRLGSLLGLAALLAAGAPAWRHWRQRLLWESTLASTTGQVLSRELPDGSSLVLDARSEVELLYFADRREARLRQGAAFFSVAKEAHRPFTVRAGEIRVTVIGTRFAVEVGVEAIVVQVESGRVRVGHDTSHDAGHDTTHDADQAGAPARTDRDGSTDRDGIVELNRGESLRIPFDSWPVGSWRRGVSDQPAAWRHGELVFADASLGEVIGRLQRYTSVRLDLDPAVAGLAISGHLRIAEAGQWLKALPAGLPLRVRDTADGGLQISARHPGVGPARPN